jgi:hypothetical protein
MKTREVRKYRIRSRVVYGSGFRTYYAQRFEGYVDGTRESWLTVARSRNREAVEAYIERETLEGDQR